MELRNIDITFTYINDKGDEETIKASIDGVVGWFQFGNTHEKLSENVKVIEAINEAVQEFLTIDEEKGGTE